MQALDIIDSNKDGFITRSEFMSHVIGATNNQVALPPVPSSNVAAFDVIDTNKDGIITRSEFDANVVIPDAPDGSDAKREAFDIIDTKKDGFITRSEFSHHVMGGTNNASFVTAAPPQVFETPKTETKKDKPVKIKKGKKTGCC